MSPSQETVQQGALDLVTQEVISQPTGPQLIENVESKVREVVTGSTSLCQETHDFLLPSPKLRGTQLLGNQ